MTTHHASHQLKWLELEAPRYTSYPSALYFQPIMPETQLEWLQRVDVNQSVALYIHIPFCKQLCWFCGCHTKIANHYSPIAAYVDVLIKEIDLIAKTVTSKIKLHSIHFGGGSPGILNVDDMEAIFKRIHSTFNVQKDVEIAIELDPRQLTTDKIKAYKRLGFNRVSLGVQDLNQTVQASIHRIQSVDEVRQCVEILRSEGIHAINMDLIYGLPFQDMTSIEKTINDVCSMAPSRIAYYSFAHVPWIKKHQQLISEGNLPTVDQKGQMYMRASKIFESNGYIPLGIDHFSMPEDDCYTGFHQRTLRRNFMGYTTQPNDFVLGIGASAISHLGGGLSQNSVSDAEYKHRIDQNTFPTARGWRYTSDDYVRKFVINELMCYFFVDLESVLKHYNYPADYFDVQLELLSTYAEAEIISITNRCIDFKSPLRMIVRSVCSVFDQYHLTLDKGRYLKIS